MRICCALSWIVRANGSRAFTTLRHTIPALGLEKVPPSRPPLLARVFRQLGVLGPPRAPNGVYMTVDGEILAEHFERPDHLKIDVVVVWAAIFAVGSAKTQFGGECSPTSYSLTAYRLRAFRSTGRGYVLVGQEVTSTRSATFGFALI